MLQNPLEGCVHGIRVEAGVDEFFAAVREVASNGSGQVVGVGFDAIRIVPSAVVACSIAAALL